MAEGIATDIRPRITEPQCNLVQTVVTGNDTSGVTVSYNVIPLLSDAVSAIAGGEQSITAAKKTKTTHVTNQSICRNA